LIQAISCSFEINQYTPARIGTIVAQLIAMVIVMLWNFFANRHWTYNDVE
jgi:putative flippase GtrA